MYAQQHDEKIVTVDGEATESAYAYSKHKLTKETTDDIVTIYTYDSNGNTLTKTSDEETTAYTYSPRNELLEVDNGDDTIKL